MKLWIFDLDGTLVDTSGDIVHAVNTLLSENGRDPLSHGDVMCHVGFGTPFLMSRILDWDMDSPRTREATERFVEIYSTLPASRSSTYPGTRETLERLGASSTLGIVSNKNAHLVHATIEAHDLAPLLTFAWGGGEFGSLKPAPDGILKAMKESSIPASSTTVVGDMPMDVEAGRRAGARTLFASWGFGRLGPGDPEPDATIRSLSEILP